MRKLTIFVSLNIHFQQHLNLRPDSRLWKYFSKKFQLVYWCGHRIREMAGSGKNKLSDLSDFQNIFENGKFRYLWRRKAGRFFCDSQKAVLWRRFINCFFFAYRVVTNFLLHTHRVISENCDLLRSYGHPPAIRNNELKAPIDYQWCRYDFKPVWMEKQILILFSGKVK